MSIEPRMTGVEEIDAKLELFDKITGDSVGYLTFFGKTINGKADQNMFVISAPGVGYDEVVKNIKDVVTGKIDEVYAALPKEETGDEEPTAPIDDEPKLIAKTKKKK